MPSTPNILIILESPALAEEIQGHLLARDYTAECVLSEEQAINGIVSAKFDLIITTVQSSKIDGLRLLDIAHGRNATTPLLLLLNDQQIELGIQGLDRGAHSVHTAPYNLDLLERHIRQGLDQQAMQYRMFQLKRQLDTHHGLSNIIGQSHAMATLHDQIRQTAIGSAPVILIGESGTGKDHLALAIHNQSNRSRRAFIKFTFTNLQQNTMDRNLFGYAPNIFPDEPKGQAGQIESADEGTLYLDNLQNISPIQRDQLIQCLENKSLQRFGDMRNIPIDIRLIISITPPLDDSDPTHEFLTSLQQKYNAITLDIPALRQRTEDITSLLHHFLSHHAQSQDKVIEGMDPSIIDVLSRYPWPENVRELYNTVEQMVINTPDKSIMSYSAIPLTIREHPTVTLDNISIPRGSDLHTVERILIEDTMCACNNNKEKCAKTLGIGLRTLYRKLQEYK